MSDHAELSRLRDECAEAERLVAKRDEQIRVLREALELIERSDTFNGGTFVKELQGIARAALAATE